MIERLRRALESVDGLPPELQEQLAEQIEHLTRSNGKSQTVATPLGMQLTALRKQIVDSGVPLLSWRDVEAEVAERRGERRPDAGQ